MKGVLVRVGIDQKYGHWNSPADEATKRFIYVPIREEEPQHPGCERHYKQLIPHLSQFASDYNLDLWRDLKFPAGLEKKRMHLDPDFNYLTYGDNGERRGRKLGELEENDLVVFYAAFNSVHLLFLAKSLIYAIIGLFVVEEVVSVNEVPEERRDENAHTRINPREVDIIVRGKAGQSGRCKKFLPMGEYRDNAYRVKKDILDDWGGLCVKNGYIQISGTLFRFCDAEKFYRWFQEQGVNLVQSNNP